MDRRAWRAAVRGVSESQTQLNDSTAQRKKQIVKVSLNSRENEGLRIGYQEMTQRGGKQEQEGACRMTRLLLLHGEGLPSVFASKV